MLGVLIREVEKSAKRRPAEVEAEIKLPGYKQKKA